MKNNKINKILNLSITSHIIWLSWVILYGLSMPPYNISYFAWVSFIPVLFYIYKFPLEKTVLYSGLYSLIYLTIVLFWLYSFWFPSVFMVIPWYAIYFIVAFFIIGYVGKKLENIRWITTPIIWVSFEFLRSIGFHGAPWVLTGHSQWKNIFMIQSADIFGVWGISFIILIVNSILAELFITWYEEKSLVKIIKINKVKLIILFFILIINYIYGLITYNYYEYISNKSPKEKLALLQPNIGSRDPWWQDRWYYYGQIWLLHAEAAIYNPDMIVWSETMVRNYIWYYLKNYPLNEEINQFNIRFLKLPIELNIPVLTTSPSEENEKSYNSADYLDPESDYFVKATNGGKYIIENHNSKIHLVAFGEWMPGYDQLPIVKRIMAIEGAGSYSPDTNFNIIKGRKSKFRVLVCFEDVIDILAKKFVDKGVNYFINVANTGWAYKHKINHPMWQHFSAALLTAISLRRPIARATNTGITGIINLNGKWQGHIGFYKRGFYIGNISIIDENIKSIYVKFGFLFPYFLVIILFFVVLYTTFFGNKSNK